MRGLDDMRHGDNYDSVRRSLLLLILLAVVSSGCYWDWDGDRQINIILPRVVELKNTSQDDIDLTTVSSSPDAKATFFLMGGPMPPGSKRSWRIGLDEYDDILSGRFVLDGRCGDKEKWGKQGTALKQHMIEQDDRGKVTIVIPACDG